MIRLPKAAIEIPEALILFVDEKKMSKIIAKANPRSPKIVGKALNGQVIENFISTPEWL